MKKLLITSILAILITGINLAQDGTPIEYLGLPGDNLNLYAVMNLFQQSETLEAFERGLNDKDSRINNLDLNGDNFVDYIMVLDYKEDNIHTIVLQVALNEKEKQDVAVFTVERFKNGSVQIQLIGDKILYGDNYIIEPIFDENQPERANPGFTGKKQKKNKNKSKDYRLASYEIAEWPLIVYIYEPDYSLWQSSWYWGFYPDYWDQWSPSYYHYYYGYHQNLFPVYYRSYRHWQYPRCTYYNTAYWGGMRNQSAQVSARITNGSYKTTYSHPELRRNGEVLYEESRSRRSANETGRKTATDNAADPSRRPGGSTTTRSSGQNAGNSRRPATSSGSNTDPVQSRVPNENIGRRPVPSTGNNNSRRPASSDQTEGTSVRPVSNPSTGTDENTGRRVQNQGRTNSTPVSDDAATRRQEPRTERPSSQPERQVSQPTRPSSQPERQVSQPTRPSSQPERQVSQPTRPSSQPERQVTQPERPSYRPERQPSQPERPAYQPERQVSQPVERPSYQPERQVSQPEPARTIEAPPPPPSREPAAAPASSSGQTNDDRPARPERR